MLAVVGPRRLYQSAGGEGDRGREDSCRISRRRSNPPSTVSISRIRGEVEERYVRWVRELRRGNDADVSRAGDDDQTCQLESLFRTESDIQSACSPLLS